MGRKGGMGRTAGALLIFWLSACAAHAQWLDFKIPGTPRTADGKPNLKAPAPKTADGRPDLTGIWTRSADRYYNNVAADLKPGDVQPWAEALYQRRKAEFGKDAMEVRCLPLGPAAVTTPFADAKIIQSPSAIAILVGDMTHRLIHLDGRPLPKDPNPSWMGYSVGRWERDTLVVETTGFTEQVWLDYDGHPHTEALRMVERYRRTSFGHLDVSVTFEDAGAFTKPWTVSVPLELRPDTEILEAVCKENEKDHAHMAAKASPPAGVVAQGLLERYAGNYEIKEKGKVRPAIIAVSGGALYLDIDRTGLQHLLPISQTTFSQSGNVLQFVADGSGAITHFLLKTVEGEDTAVRAAQSPASLSPLAPTGTLRGVFLGSNPVQGRVNAATGEATGPVPDLVREIAKRIGVASRVIPAPDAAGVIAALNNGSADVGFLAYDETRAREVDFGAPFAVMLNSYLVKAGSPIRASADVDRAGITVAAVKGQTQELFVSRSLKNARVRIFQTMPPQAEVERLLTSGEVDVFAINRQRSLEAEAASASKLRALADSFLEVDQSFVVVKGSRAKLAAIDRLMAEIGASGFMKSSIERAGLTGVRAPGAR
jgi:polar amino acid transport system substrate-binding protein